MKKKASPPHARSVVADLAEPISVKTVGVVAAEPLDDEAIFAKWQGAQRAHGPFAYFGQWRRRSIEFDLADTETDCNRF